MAKIVNDLKHLLEQVTSQQTILARQESNLKEMDNIIRLMLQTLVSNKMITVKQEGDQIYYSLPDQAV